MRAEEKIDPLGSPATSLPLRFSQWLPAPPADPDFLRRVRRLRWEKAGIVVVLAGAWVAVFALVALIPHGSGIMGGLWTTGASITYAIWIRVRTRRATPEVADLLDLPAVCPQFPVELRYAVQGSAYGSDEGVISFADGWMHFQGRRSSWSLQTSDVVTFPGQGPVVRSRWNQSVADSSIVKKLVWTNRKKSYQIQILPIDSVEGLGKGLQRGFDQELERWKVRSSSGEGSAIMPPTELMPGTAERLALAYRVWNLVTWGLGFAAVLSIVQGVLRGWPMGWITAAVVLGAVFLLAAVTGLSLVAKLTNLGQACTDWTDPSRKRRAPSATARAMRWLQSQFLASKSKSRALALADSRPTDSREAIPVEVMFAVWSREYRREVGWLLVEDGWLHFRGNLSSWSLNRSCFIRHNAAEESWRMCFEETQPLVQTLEIPVSEGVVTAWLLPLDPLGPARNAERLRRLLDVPEGAAEAAEGGPEWPVARPESGKVQRLEKQYDQLAAVPVVAFAIVVVAVVVSGASVFFYIPGAIFAAILLFAGLQRRKAIEKQLEAIRIFCLAIHAPERLQPANGPWWRRRPESLSGPPRGDND